MLLTISLAFLLFLILAGFLVASPLASRRSQQLRHLCHEQHNHKWHYRPYGQLAREVKAGRFEIIERCEHRLFRHMVEGYWPSPQIVNSVAGSNTLTLFNLLDCSLVAPHETLTQTLIMMPLQSPMPSEFKCLISPKHSNFKHFSGDAFAEYQDDQLKSLLQHQVPTELSERHIASSKPGFCSSLVHEMPLKHWLLTYPHLHIEISNDILLVYKQNSIVDAADITTALDIVAELNRFLANNNKTMDSK